MSYYDPRTVMEAIRTRLYQLGWGSDPEALESVYAEGTIYFAANPNDVNEQLKKLIALDDRSCLIVPGADRYPRRREGQILTTTRIMEFWLFHLDSAISVAEESIAFFGDETTPGVFNVHEGTRDLLEDTPLDATNLPHAWAAIDEGEPATFKDTDTGPAKAGYAQTLSVAMGTKRRNLGRTAHATNA